MAEKILNDRIALLSVLDSFGEEGATFQEIQYAYGRMTKKNISQRQFQRCKEDLEHMFGVRVVCPKSGPGSKHYLDKSGTSPLKEDKLRMSCMNAYLLNNIVSDDRFTKDRIYIADSYNNEQARAVANAMAQKRNIIVTQRYNEYINYVDENGKPFLKIKSAIRDFEFIPYALSYTACWYMFGKMPGRDELLVYSMQNIESVKLLSDFDDYPEEFDLRKVLDAYDTAMPFGDLSKAFDKKGGFAPDFHDDRILFWRSMQEANDKNF